jgi:DNA-binding NarL/FixJ family response regulator
MSDDIQLIREMWHLGAKGYLLKDIHPDDLLVAIESVALGGSYYSPEVSDKINHLLNKENSHLSQRNNPPTFSPMEKKILVGICKGLTCKEIGGMVQLAARTVEHYIERMRTNTNSKNTTELATLAVLHGILNKDDLT